MEELVAKTELEREAARLERELQDLEALLAKERERLSALSPVPVYWRRVRCDKACGGCPHGPYPYLKVSGTGSGAGSTWGKGGSPPRASPGPGPSARRWPSTTPSSGGRRSFWSGWNGQRRC
jgi:hypothetical protein